MFINLCVRFTPFASTVPSQTHCLQRPSGVTGCVLLPRTPLMTPTLATPHLRDLREVLHEAIQQAQDAIRRTREMLHRSDDLLTPDAAPEPDRDEQKK
jgi:hypothetical protein